MQRPRAEDIELVFNVPYLNGTDLAFDGNHVYAGQLATGQNPQGGVRIYDVSDPRDPVELGRYYPGPQGPGDAGIRLDAQPQGEGRLADWILHQRDIEIRNGAA